MRSISEHHHGKEHMKNDHGKWPQDGKWPGHGKWPKHGKWSGHEKWPEHEKWPGHGKWPGKKNSKCAVMHIFDIEKRSLS